MKKGTVQKILYAFARTRRASARKKVYSQKALRDDKPKTAYLLKAISESEAVQARRLLHLMIGKIDITDSYQATIFENEIQELIELYRDDIAEAESNGDTAAARALAQLQKAEKRLTALYDRSRQEITEEHFAEYYVCPFCGYLSKEQPPEECPICGANGDKFKKIN